MNVDSPPALKRKRFSTIHPMDFESAKAKLAAAKEKFGREIRVFETSIASLTSSDVSNADESDDFYEFTPEDYYRLMATKKEDKHLKTRKIREAEEAARRSRITKSVIRIRFPDNYTLEAVFHPSETLQSLVDLLMKVVNQPEVPFYIYTTPPKKQIKEMSQDFYSAGFIPGAIVYFAYDLPKGDDGNAMSGPYLKEEVMSLQGLEFITEEKVAAQAAAPEPEPIVSSSTGSAPAPPENKSDKKNIKPKWLKL
ncbi:hypothetical protein M9H77_37140 [Catharanthus roseus]|uniref:Uncharacterized protein n=1 Tax=Catharanthus roseus TaxID=4058 RepID=A0ACB9ZUP4_CATRO|nr:hypothetical protein M9H77_37140 [Catharanthus roseus]